MSYVLHVWEQPVPASVEEAGEIVFERPPGRRGQNPLFLRFAQALTAVYPDSDIDSTVWTDGPLDGVTDEPIFVLGLLNGRLDEHIIPFIAHTAADLGLHVFDMQEGVLYRPDRRFIGTDGKAKPLPPRLTPVPKPLAPQLYCAGVKRDLLELVIRKFGTAGWRGYFLGYERDDWIAWRRHGLIWQAIRFSTGDEDGAGPCRLAVSFHFSADPIRDALVKLLPERLAEYGFRPLAADLDRPPLKPQITTSMYELFGQDLAAQVESQAEVEAWGERFCRWYESRAAQALDACTDLAGLDRLLHTPGRRGRSAPHAWQFHTLCSTLAVLYLCNHPEFDAWSALVHSHARRMTGLYGHDSDFPRLVGVLIERLKRPRSSA